MPPVSLVKTIWAIKDEMLPTNHGFDEFFGNLYHLNAEEEPENEDYPKDPEFRKKFGPRGVIKSFADGKIEDTGPLTKNAWKQWMMRPLTRPSILLSAKSRQENPSSVGGVEPACIFAPM